MITTQQPHHNSNSSSSIAKKAKLPTRSRLSIHHQQQQQQQQQQNQQPNRNHPFCHQHYHSSSYAPRLLFSLGIVQLLSGVALVFLSLVAFRLDRERALAWSVSLHYLEGVLPEVLRIIWLGAWIVTSALLTLLATFRPSSALLHILLLLTALVTVAITGAFAILLANHVLQNSLLSSVFSSSRESVPPDSVIGDNGDGNADAGDQPEDRTLSYSSRTSGAYYPAAHFHVFIISLCLFCTLSFVISIISCSIVSHQLCSCRPGWPFTTADSGHYLAPYQIYTTNGSASSSSSSNTWSKKQRIVQWVMQQSQQQVLHDSHEVQSEADVPVVVHHHHPHPHHHHHHHQYHLRSSQQHLVLDQAPAGALRKKPTLPSPLSGLQLSLTSSSTKLSIYES
ncbi:hypothetical protein TYRP_018407 [Tyrophagus putrescentiae]|nr:hypothetical protein TYRP_018407 [Tyrophagus putrescentiae]